jgi:type IV secretion system protein VirD4
VTGRRYESAVVLGRWGRDVLRERGEPPLLVVGPTGAGKTSTVVLPTLLEAWRESAVVWDFKGTLARQTGAARERFGDVAVLDLARRGSVRFNPLMAVRPGDHLVADAQHAARVLTEEEGESHWQRAAFSYLAGAIVYLLTSGSDADKCLAGLRRHVVAGDAGARRMMGADVHPTARHAAEELWAERARAEAGEVGPEAPAKRRGGMEGGQGGGQDRTLNYRKSVYVTCSVLLAEFEDAVLAANTARSDFAVSDLVAGPRPLTLYVPARPMDVRRLRRVFRLMLTQMVDRLTVETDAADDGRARRWRVLFVLDEFLQLGVPEAAAWVRYVRDYGVRMLLLAQSLGEVEAAYGQGLAANCRLAMFRPNGPGEAERLSRLVGEAIEEVPTLSTSRRHLLDQPVVTRGTRVDRRPALPAAEVLELDPDELVLFGWGKPIRARGIPVWRERPWAGLMGPPCQAFVPRDGANPWLGKEDGADPQPPRRPGRPNRPVVA